MSNSEQWPIRMLGDVTENLDSRRIPVRETDRVAGPFPYYGASGIVDYVNDYIFDGEYVLVAEDGENLRTRKTPIALLVRGQFWVNNHAHILRGNDLADTRFLSYAISQADISSYLTGSTMPKLTQGNLKRVPLLLPPLDEQRRIAHILGTLDDKIELNRKMNETLEEIARTLFTSWFVNFDPVRAKAEGREPFGMDAETAALFPDSFVDSELGPIPSGWNIVSIGSLCKSIENGGTPKRMTAEYWGGTIRWFKTGEFTDGPLIDSEEHITELGLAESSCKLWPKDTLLIALYASPTVGRLGILESPAASNQACSGLIVRDDVGHFFLFQSLLNSRERLQRIAVGAAQQNISQQVVRDHKVVSSSRDLSRKYHDLVSPVYERIAANLRESSTLADTRDTLLPNLLSGRLRVPEAERIAEEVAV